MKRDQKEEITNKVIKAMENGISWKSGLPDVAPLWSNSNSLSKNQYQGVNQFLLTLEILEKGYPTNEWGTYKQISQMGGKVIKGEKGTKICFYKDLKIKDEEEKTINIPLLRLYTVFNLSQTTLDIKESINIKLEEKELLQKAEEFIPTSADIRKTDLMQPFYSLTGDYINIPKARNYDTIERYYSALFHELGHWTGSKERLNRTMKQDIENYSKEELVAELTSSIICSKLGIRNQEILDNQGAYLRGWIKALKDDKNLLFSATSKAWKAVEYIESSK